MSTTEAVLLPPILPLGRPSMAEILMLIPAANTYPCEGFKERLPKEGLFGTP